MTWYALAPSRDNEGVVQIEAPSFLDAKEIAEKWLGIAERFPSMSPLEQRRIQSQMQVWGKLTPEQRELARKNFLTAKQLPEQEKQALRQKWQEYSFALSFRLPRAFLCV